MFLSYLTYNYYEMKKTHFFNLLIYILICGFVVTIHLAVHPLGFNNYGYDYGFYAYAIQHTPLDSLRYLAGQVNDYGNHLFVFINWLRLPQLPALHILFVTFYALSGVIFYLILRRYGRIAAMTGVILLALSIAQTQSYSMFLWKTAYGQLLLLIMFLLIQNKKAYWELLPFALIIITHKTSAIIATASLIPYYIFGEIKHKTALFVILLSGILVFLFGLNGYHYIQQLLNSNVQNGQFINITDYLRHAWYLIPLSIFSVFSSVRHKNHLQWLGLLVVSLVFILFQLTFFQRIILYMDLALIYFASLSIAQLSVKQKYKFIISGLVIIISLGNFLNYSTNINPLISEEEVTEIQEFTLLNQGAFVVSLSAQDAPWLLANLSGNVRLAAPGLYEDKKSQKEWEEFWMNPTNQTFFAEYPKPLFVYQRSSRFYPTGWECLNKVSEHFYKYSCAN